MPFAGNRLSVLERSKIVADQIHQVCRILAVMNGEGRIQPDFEGVVAQEPGADRMERAGPCQAFRQDRRVGAHDFRGDALDAPGHFRRRSARKGHQQDTARVGAIDNQMRDAMRQRVGLAGSSPGDDQQRSGDPGVAMHHRPPLLGVEPGEVVRRGDRIMGGNVHI